MDLAHITNQGSALDDPEILARLPQNLAGLLTSLNGFIQFGGGLHVRGACMAPDWHALRRAWEGPGSFSSLFEQVSPDWIPFAEDCVGDQFLLNGSSVLRLMAETGEVEDMGVSLAEFLQRASADPVAYLGMEPLLQVQQDQGQLADGDLIHAYPPFCTKEAANGVSLAAVPAWELHQFHADLAKAMA